MTHSNITFNVQSWRSGEPKCLHVSVNLSFKNSGVWPRTTKSGNQFVVNGTAELVNQLNAFCGSVMGITAINIFMTFCTLFKSVIWLTSRSLLCRIHLRIFKQTKVKSSSSKRSPPYRICFAYKWLTLTDLPLEQLLLKWRANVSHGTCLATLRRTCNPCAWRSVTISYLHVTFWGA